MYKELVAVLYPYRIEIKKEKEVVYVIETECVAEAGDMQKVYDYMLKHDVDEFKMVKEVDQYIFSTLEVLLKMPNVYPVVSAMEKWLAH